MLDIIAIGLFARSRGRRAEEKAHNGGSYIALTAALGFGGELAGGILGMVGAGNFGPASVMLGIVGAFAGCVVAWFIVERLPDQRDPDRIGPSSMKVQIAGSTCTLCQGNIATALDGAECPRCGETVHMTCGPAHDEAKHPEAADYRANAKKKKKKKAADDSSSPPA